MSTDSYDERIAALKARIEQARTERDNIRVRAAAAEEAAKQEREAESLERHERLTGQMRDISDELSNQSVHIQQERADIERRKPRDATHREDRAGRFTELTNTLSALRQSMQEDRERRKVHDAKVQSSESAFNVSSYSFLSPYQVFSRPSAKSSRMRRSNEMR